jgi:hypothetical protein
LKDREEREYIKSNEHQQRIHDVHTKLDRRDEEYNNLDKELRIIHIDTKEL